MIYKTNIYDTELIETGDRLEKEDIIMITKSDPTGYCYPIYWKVVDIYQKKVDSEEDCIDYVELDPLSYKIAKICK